MTTISSQRYRNPAIVEEKRAARDYIVSYVEVAVDSDTYRVIVDGHHSHAAALADGVEPVWNKSMDLQREADRLGAEAFLDAHHEGDDYYDVTTGYPVF